MVKRFLNEDFEQITSWYEKRGMNKPDKSMYPAYGLIEPGVAAGWLILTDAKIGILEHYATNPDATIRDRDKALDEITEKLIDYGKKFGLKHFMCTTNFPTIGQRAMRHKFDLVGQFHIYFKKGKD